MREGRRTRGFLTCVLLVWLLLVFWLYLITQSVGGSFLHTAEDRQLVLPSLTKDFCLPALRAFDTSPVPNVIALIVWGGAFGMPALAIVLAWKLRDIQQARWWVLFLGVCNVAWIVIVGLITAIGIWLPYSRIGR